ncbi:hypothetical protein AMECASPLE_029681 [Ameca splendens]|uniref:Uncharacterized protein n=1 Tax=Ameca splendens TaxID=208324 RepID=A0ABV0Z405_9TELE
MLDHGAAAAAQSIRRCGPSERSGWSSTSSQRLRSSAGWNAAVWLRAALPQPVTTTAWNLRGHEDISSKVDPGNPARLPFSQSERESSIMTWTLLTSRSLTEVPRSSFVPRRPNAGMR